MRRAFHVIPAFCHPWALIRMIIPSRYQTFHSNWQFQGRRVSHYPDSRIMSLISLFGEDMVYVADPEGIMEVSTNPNKYPKAIELYGILR
jgi:hypothetical protein